MGFGGVDGDGSDDDREDLDLKKMIDRKRMKDGDLKADEIRDLHRYVAINLRVFLTGHYSGSPT